jgi:hypothetical protein
MIHDEINQKRYCDQDGNANAWGISCCNTTDCNQPRAKPPDAKEVYGLIYTLKAIFTNVDFSPLQNAIKGSDNTTYLMEALASFAFQSGDGRLKAFFDVLFSTGTLNRTVNALGSQLPKSLEDKITYSGADFAPTTKSSRPPRKRKPE